MKHRTVLDAVTAIRGVNRSHPMAMLHACVCYSLGVLSYADQLIVATKCGCMQRAAHVWVQRREDGHHGLSPLNQTLEFRPKRTLPMTVADGATQ